MLNRILACGLAVALFVSSPITAFADEISDDVNVETSVENTSEGVADSADSDSAANDSSSEESSSDEAGQTNSDGSVSEDKSSTNNEVNKDNADDKSGTSVDKSSNEKASEEPTTDEQITDKEVVDESELTPEELEKLEQEKLEKEKLEKEKLSEEDKEIEYSYSSNGDGTHTKKWVDEDGVEHEEIEDCEFDEDGVCIHCGYKNPEFEMSISDSDGIVTITGSRKALNGAKSVKVEEITEDSDEEQFAEMADALDETVDEETKVVDFIAYDITLFDEDDDEVEPDGEVKVVFNNPSIEGLDDEEYETAVFHYEDSENVNKMEDVKSDDNSVEMTTNHFSTYIVAITGSNKGQLFDSEYIDLYAYYEAGSYNWQPYDKWEKANSLPSIEKNNDSYYYKENGSKKYSYYPVVVRVYKNNTLVEENKYAVSKDKKEFYFKTDIKDSDTYAIEKVTSGYNKSNGTFENIKPYQDTYYYFKLENYLNKENKNADDANKKVNYFNVYIKSSKKTLTINKIWDDKDSTKRPTSGVDFSVYGSYEDSNGTVYLNSDGTTTSSKVAFTTANIKSEDATSDTTWSKTINGLPIFVGGDINKVIVWTVEENEVKGYEAGEWSKAIDESTSVVTTVEPTYPTSRENKGGRYQHVDIEVDAASDSNSSTKRTVESFKSINDHNNQITIVGYYDWYGWVSGSKDVAPDDNTSSNGEWRADVTVGDNTAVILKARFNDSDDYKTVVLTSDDVYPAGTKLKRPADKQNEWETNYPLVGFKNLLTHYNLDSNAKEIDLSGKNIFEVAKYSCPGGPISGGSYGNQAGLDFILSPKTIEENIVTNGTGNETHTITNTQLENATTIDTKVDKSADLKNWNGRTYTINLDAESIKTKITQISKEKPVDLILVIDTSKSMDFPSGLVKTNDTWVNWNKTYYEIAQTDQATVYRWQSSNGNWYRQDASASGLGTQQKEAPSVSNLYEKPANSTTRWAHFEEAAKSLVDNMANGSQISIVGFNKESSNERFNNKEIVTISDDNRSTIKNTISNMHSKLASGTRQDRGMQNARDLLNRNEYRNSDHAKFVILLTDGCPNPGNSGGTVEGVISSATNSANQMKQAGATVYSIGIDLDVNSAMGTAKRLLRQCASGEEYYFNKSADDLEPLFEAISKMINGEVESKEFATGDVTDVVDKRFDLVADNGTKVTSNGTYTIGGKQASCTLNSDGTTTIVWHEQKLEGWNASFTIKAKEDFLGGNVVATNTSDSGVTVEGEETKFPEPSVNVKPLEFEMEGGEETKFLGERLDIYNEEKAIQFLISQISSTSPAEIKDIKITKNNNGNYSYEMVYKYPGTDDELGTIKGELTKESNEPFCDENGIATKLGTPVETYTLTVSYNPYPVSQRNNMVPAELVKPNMSEEAETVSMSASYKINVITCDLVVTKYGLSYVENAQKKELEGATYSIYTKDNNGEYVKVDGATATSDKNGLMVFKNLRYGTYYLKEDVAPKDYALNKTVYEIKVAREEGSSFYTVDIQSDENQGLTNLQYSITAEKSGETVKAQVYMGHNKVEYVQSKVLDRVAYTLPETGGSGVYVYTIGGILLMIAGALLLYKNKNNKKQ